jgi:hypothetical protein
MDTDEEKKMRSKAINILLNRWLKKSELIQKAKLLKLLPIKMLTKKQGSNL